MTDGLGSKTYAYNQLSQMTSETRAFASVGSYTLSYDYNLAGELKSLTDPFGSTANYSRDNAGRLSGVSVDGFGTPTQYASNIQYRAWGGIKHQNYGNGLLADLNYDSRMQITHFEIPTVMRADYQHYADGRLSYSHDLDDARYDRAYNYDHAARITMDCRAQRRAGCKRPMGLTKKTMATMHLPT